MLLLNHDLDVDFVRRVIGVVNGHGDRHATAITEGCRGVDLDEARFLLNGEIQLRRIRRLRGVERSSLGEVRIAL